MYETGRFTHGEYHTLDTAIKQVMRRSAGDAVMLGYLLRRMMDERLWTAALTPICGRSCTWTTPWHAGSRRSTANIP